MLVSHLPRKSRGRRGFFSSYPAFFESSMTGVEANRLNKRWEAIFGRRPAVFKGARVLDLASHDGRWSFAAHKAGASYVVGVEARTQLVEAGIRNFRNYGIPSSSFQLVTADAFEYLRRGEKFDVVLCLGFLYHTYHHPYLISLIKRAEPRHIVVDSQVSKLPGRCCEVRLDSVDKEWEAFSDDSSYEGRIWVATPTKQLLMAMIHSFGFRAKEVDWTSILADGNIHGVRDYAELRRVTIHGTVDPSSSPNFR
jgi:2-polyprenyl-3-methyl-5-hydroxy-6-metoxy-1,4-benzoquinol methylase